MTSIKMWLLTFVRRWLCGRVQANIVPTAWLGGILCLSRTTAIPHGLAAVDCTQQAMPSGSAPKFVFVGRLVTTKGVRTLLESAQRLREDGLKFCVEIIGEGPESARLKGLASDLGLQGCVEFRGRLPAHELDAALRSASAVVMPSLGGEVFGLVAAEAMARGRAVIASDLGALREVVGDAGWLFPPGDAQALAQALREVIGDPHAALRRGAIGQERVRRLFSLQAMIDKHLDVYRHWIH